MENGVLEMEQRNIYLVGDFGLKEGVCICNFWSNNLVMDF